VPISGGTVMLAAGFVDAWLVGVLEDTLAVDVAVAADDEDDVLLHAVASPAASTATTSQAARRSLPSCPAQSGGFMGITAFTFNRVVSRDVGLDGGVRGRIVKRRGNGGLRRWLGFASLRPFGR
jgi:hypothetical protein